MTSHALLVEVMELFMAKSLFIKKISRKSDKQTSSNAFCKMVCMHMRNDKYPAQCFDINMELSVDRSSFFIKYIGENRTARSQEMCSAVKFTQTRNQICFPVSET